MKWHLVTPALKVSGGNRELLQLGGQLAARGADVDVVSLWRADNPIASVLPVAHQSDWRSQAVWAPLQWPLLALAFRRWMRSDARASASEDRYLFTHYSTLPLAALVPRERRYFFVQDLEWKFVHNRLLSWLLRRAILFFYRRGSLVSANAYLTSSLRQLGLPVLLEAPIWAAPDYLTSEAGPRDIDFVMMLRKGAHKRLADYHAFIELARRGPRKVTLAAISPDDDLIAEVSSRVDFCLTRPTRAQMRALYQRAHCFVHLSEHEGFGLPPLEAMGAGCIPLCRDSGGVRAFMAAPELVELLLPAEADVEEVYRRGCQLLDDPVRAADYSRRAREVFRRGSLATAQASDAAVTALSRV